jgi:tetratricopeptide (TPR) repeat protein
MIVTICRFARLLALALAALSAVRPARAQNPPPGSTPAPAASRGPALEDAQHLYRTGKLDAAIQEYTQLESGQQAGLAYAGITHVYLAKKDPSEAYRAAAKAMDLAPKSPEAQVAQGEALFRVGKIHEAEAAFVAVINSGAENARAYYGLARVSQTITYFHRMKTMIDKAHELDPNDRDITRLWMGTLEPGERIRALHDYLALETDDDAETRMALERELVNLQDTPTIPAHPCRITSQIKSTTTDLRELLDSPTRLRGYGLDVKFNGTTGHLLLDTGAAGILIDQKLAEKAGVQHVVESSVRGIGDKGSAGAYVGHVDKIQVGDVEFADCNVRVIDQNSVINSDGLIGAVEFSQFLVELDMPNRKMRLSQLPPRPNEAPTQTALGSGPAAATPRFYDRYVAPEMQDYTRIFRINHMLLIPTEINSSAGRLFLIDTGSLTNIVTPEAAREVTRVGNDPNLRVKGVSGEVKNVYSADKLTLAFANLRQENQDMLSVDMKNMSDGAGTEISGTLGFTVLRMLDIKIDYRDALVWFGYNWKHPF